MRPFLIVAALLGAACRNAHPGTATPVRTTRDTSRVARDTALESRAARLELKVLEQGAQVEELQTRLDDARREVVRAMAKLQSLATRAEAASGMAEAEIALQALRSANGSNSQSPPEYAQGTQLLQLSTGEFDQQNYAGALYLATEAKNAAAAGQGGGGGNDRGGGAEPQRGNPFSRPAPPQKSAHPHRGEGAGPRLQVPLDPEKGRT